MRRSTLLILIAAIALAVVLPATASSGAGSTLDAEATAAKGKKAGKKKAAKCKTAKKKGKAKGKARKSVATDSAAKGKAKGKGKKKAKTKKNCAKAKAKPKTSPQRRPGRVRNPHEERLIDRLRERRESRPTPQPAPTIEDMVPADGTYASPSAPGLSVTISGNGTTARVVYTVPKTAFDSLCQAHTEGVPVDLSGPLAPSQSTKRGHITVDDSRPIPDSRSWTVTGSIGQDGSFTMSVRASFPYPPDPNATCSGYANLSGTLVPQ